MKLKNSILFWLFVGLFYHAKSQSYIDSFKTILNNNTFLSVESKIDSLINVALTNKDYLESAKLCDTSFLHLYRRDKNYRKAIKYGLIGIESFEKLNHLEEDYTKILYNLGWAYYRIKVYDSSITYHKKVIALNYSEEKIAQAYCEIGRNYSKLGDFYKAEEFYSKGIKMLEAQKKHKVLVGKYFGLINVYIALDTENSLKAQFNVLNKAKELNLSPRQQRSLDNYFANYYSNPKTFNFNQAKLYFQKNLTKSIKEKDSVFICASYINLGDIYNEIRNDSASYFLDKSEAFCKRNDFKSIAFHQYSKFFFYKDNLNKSIEYIDKSIVEAVPTITEVNQLANDHFLKVSDKFNLLLAIDQKAEIFMKYFENSGKKQHIADALKQLHLIDNFIDAIENNTYEEKSQLHWRENASKTYSKAIACANLLNQPELAFYFNEKSKALLLTEGILKNNILSKLPKAIAEREYTLKKNILELESELQNNADDHLFNLKTEYQNFTDTLKVKFPEYYNNKAKTKLYSLEDVKNLIEEDVVVVAYNWNVSKETNTINGLAFSKHENLLFSIKNASDVKERIDVFKSMVSKPFKTRKESDEFFSIAHQLYQQLVPEAVRKFIRKKQLIIIPDGALQNLSFEALISDIETKRFLIEDHLVSYAFSMSFLLNNQSITRHNSKELSAFAPISFSDQDLNVLKQTEFELNAIQRIFKSSIYKSNSANKENFLNHTRDSKIVHLATHADASGDPWIAFYDDKLKLHELYTYKNNAELTVLSACKTAQGDFALGEGVMSLARGFFYSGSNSVVSSLWNVDDASTATIMSHFYKRLKKGDTKSLALQKAKLNYIKTHSLSETSPYYWSSFILIGSPDRLVEPTNSYWFYIFILLFASATLVLVKKQIQKKSKL